MDSSVWIGEHYSEWRHDSKVVVSRASHFFVSRSSVKLSLEMVLVAAVLCVPVGRVKVFAVFTPIRRLLESVPLLAQQRAQYTISQESL